MQPFLNLGPPSKSSFRDFLANLGVVLGVGKRPLLPAGVVLWPSHGKYGDVTRGRLPSRGLLYSFLAHEIAVFAILLIPPKFRPERRFIEIERWLPANTKLALTLPAIGGGHEGGGRPGGKPGGGSPQKGGASPAPAPRAGGLVYSGPQPIVSNPPHPTNRIQTILQPDLVKPPELKVPLPLPNMVMLARGPRTPTPPPLVPKLNPTALAPVRPPEAPKLLAEMRAPRLPYALPVPATPPPPEPPKLALPPPTPEPPKEPAVSYQTTVPKIAAEAEQAPPAAPEAPDLAMPAGAGGTEERSILVLSPTPGPPENAGNLPAGEAHGQFAMGPEPNLTARSGVGPGTGTGTETGGATSGTGTGTGTGGSGSGMGSGTGEGGGGGGGTGGGTGSGTGSGVGPGSGTGSGGSGTGSGYGINGTGGGGTGTGTGTGAGSGPGRGYGTGTGSGTGTGAGSGPGTGPFPGISIVGGSGTSGISSSSRSGGSRTRTPPGPHGTYGMTIVATASSGGGLRDYGIFRNESVFTVYIDMTHSADPAPSWTLQYALLRRASDPSTITLGGSVQMSDQVVAPYPISKEEPQFPEEVVAKNLSRLVVVYAEISNEGKVEHTRVIQSPNPLLNEPVLEALAKWTFRPAEMNGAPVAVKALIGVPLSLPPR
jgi:hypothetical protein